MVFSSFPRIIKQHCWFWQFFRVSLLDYSLSVYLQFLLQLQLLLLGLVNLCNTEVISNFPASSFSICGVTGDSSLGPVMDIDYVPDTGESMFM
jgi:hypothetical protein